jgi:hypothetical protein
VLAPRQAGRTSTASKARWLCMTVLCAEPAAVSTRTDGGAVVHATDEEQGVAAEAAPASPPLAL